MNTSRHTLGGALASALLALVATHANAASQASYNTPQAAADALVQAIATGDDVDLEKTLGSDFRRFVPRDSIDRDDIYTFLAAWAKQHRVVNTSSTTAEFVVGEHDWTFPAPLVKQGAGWRFDMRAGILEMHHRRIDRNEDGAIETLRQLCAAQDRYRGTVGNGQPAQRIVSREGQHDGLYWDEGGSTSAPSPLNDDALVMGADVPVDAALHGYRYAYVQTSDPSGCSFAAWPASYGKTGQNSFVIGPDKTVRERNFGRAVNETELKRAASADNSAWQKVSP